MAAEPSRIDLLELDIDLRTADLWRELTEQVKKIDLPENLRPFLLEFVGSFQRAAYGKGYCDALAEEVPGQLCIEHKYEIPKRRQAA